MVLEEDLAACGKLVSLLKELVKSAHENEIYFENLKNTGKLDETLESIAHCFAEVRVQIGDGLLPVVKQLYSVAHKYDPCPGIKANGIRSWLGATEKMAVDILAICSFAAYKRTSYFFRKVAFAYKLKAHTDYVRSLRTCMDIVLRMSKTGNGSTLICDTNLDESVCADDVVDLISEMRQIDVAAFCGKTPSFHLCESAQSVCQGILLAFATYSAAYGPVSPLQSAIHSHSKPKEKTKQASSGAGFWSLLSNPEILSQQVLWALANFDVGLVKRFWLLGDNPLLLSGADLLISSVGMSHAINLHSIPLQVKTQAGLDIQVEPPSTFCGIKPVKARLISEVHRQGQEYWFSSGYSDYSPKIPPSDTIVFQVHGGGFICQSSRAQEIYLRQFCCETHVPFFCVDYSLLPEDPFPRAIEEVVFGYCWMLNNFAKLGTTGKRIVAIGDSAGGCLLLSMSLQLIQMDVRCPDAMLLIYPYACSSIAPSPSRLLGLADPIVPIPLLVRCCCSYANLTEHDARLVLGIGTPDLRHLCPLYPANSPDSPPHCCCPETPIPSPTGPANSGSRRNSLTSPGQDSSRHRRAQSFPSPVMPTSKSVGSALGKVTENGGLNFRHSRNKSFDCRDSGIDLNFSRMRMSESERITLADLLGLPIFSDPLFSPLTAPDVLLSKLPPLHMVGSTSDPILDDSVTLCRRLRQLGKRCDFTVVEGVPHGFLNLALVSRACGDALNRVCDILKQLVKEKPAASLDSMPLIAVQEEKSSILARSASSIYDMFSALSIFSIKRRIFVAGDAADDGF